MVRRYAAVRVRALLFAAGGVGTVSARRRRVAAVGGRAHDGLMPEMSESPRCTIVPPYLLEALSSQGSGAAAHGARRTLTRDGEWRARRGAGRGAAAGPTPGSPVPSAPAVAPDDGTHPQRAVSDAHGTETLPGSRVRAEGDPKAGDAAADEAYDGLGATWQLYREQYGRDSLDGRGLPLLASVHYGRDYDNAFWDGTQMVFGD